MKLQTRATASHDSDMTKQYLGMKQFAERVGMTSGALGSFKSLPEPDVIVGEGPRAAKGWSIATIDKWQESRPGSGNWGGKKPAKK